jgi:hypothetical protein
MSSNGAAEGYVHYFFGAWNLTNKGLIAHCGRYVGRRGLVHTVAAENLAV